MKYIKLFEEFVSEAVITNREKALKWFNDLGDRTKTIMIKKFASKTNIASNRQPDSLTGREIEMLYDKYMMSGGTDMDESLSLNEGQVKAFYMYKEEVEKIIRTSLPDDDETNTKILNCFKTNTPVKDCARQFKIEDQK